MSTQHLGLTTAEAEEIQRRVGKNELTSQKRQSLFVKILHILCEPMFLLLILAAVIYFVLGEPRDGAIMLIFVLGIIGIDVIQEWKTDKTLNALRDLSMPRVIVMRDGVQTRINTVDLVPGDVMIIAEGDKIPADGEIVKQSDLCVDESSLTGESEGVWKTVAPAENNGDYWRKDYCYAGTLVTQGSAYVRVDKIGASTEYGKIGKNIVSAPEAKTPLQKQTGTLVTTCAIIAAVLFLIVAVATWFNIADHAVRERVIESILSGITLAMAMIPEEFPVILVVFLSIGAWRLAKKSSLVRKLPSVETLGAVSVLCVDKTGTLTMNRMSVQETWSPTGDISDVIETMALACETDAYDPMEQAMMEYCISSGIDINVLRSGELVTEYPFTNEQKMMGHVWQKNGVITIAAKGSPERIFTLCDFNESEWNTAEEAMRDMSCKGLRVIAVAFAAVKSVSDVPKNLSECNLSFLGLVGLADPPRENIAQDIENCNKAGIRVVMITGDNGITAAAIAKKVGMKNCNVIITGDMLNTMTDDELRERVKNCNIFSRVVPEHKMRIIKAFSDNGEVVAMTGDGVNDAPALKYADIGIAMGKRGSEVSREAADLILMDDNFTTIVDTVKDGRRIYDNIRKAVGYVFTIHIPIALSSLLGPMLGIAPGDLLLLPLHVVLLELIIDPTCSVVLERQPAELNIMERPPRNSKEKLLNASVLIKSVTQGLVIFAAAFGAYYYLLTTTGNALVARSVALGIIMLSNVLLVQVNSSERDYAFNTFKRLITDKVMWIAELGNCALFLIAVYSPLNSLLKLAPLSGVQLLITVGVSFAAVMWYELVKLFKHVFGKSK